MCRGSADLAYGRKCNYLSAVAVILMMQCRRSHRFDQHLLVRGHAPFETIHIKLLNPVRSCMKKWLIVLCAVIVTCSLLTALLLLKLPSATSDVPAPPTPTPTPTSAPTPTPTATPISTAQPVSQELQQAINQAITFLNQTEHPIGLMMLNVIYRQFGIAEFEDSLQRYDQLYASGNDPLIPIWRRIADYNTSAVQPEDFNAVTDPLDRLTIPALFSDRRSLPDDYVSELTGAVDYGYYCASQPTNDGSIDDGAYLLTHALLATIWLQDNHCNIQLPDGFISDLYQMNAALIGDGSRVNDIQLEAAAFLYEAGQGSLVNSAFVQNVIAAQFTDGGWFADQNARYYTDWHPSVLALMIVLHVAHPVTSYPPMIAPPPN